MKIKLLVSRAGPGIAQGAGDEIDVDERVARSMIAAGQAVAVRSQTREKAVKRPRAEKAVK